MEIGDIIYFLLIAVGIFSSFFKKKKKSKSTSPKYDEIIDENKQPVEDLLESYFPNSNPIEKEDKVIFKEPEEIKKELDPFKKKPISRSKRDTESIVFLEEDQEIKRKEIEFDLRQAVINDAILNRPKF